MVHGQVAKERVPVSGQVPDSWKEAIVVSIYKGKGLDTDPANYRPISLLNSIYKVFAAMLQTRLARQREEHLRKTQYGLRAGRGASHPLHILRRSMEWSEMTNTPLYYLFLDWKQAFDSIDHNSMMIALRRFGVSDRSHNIISTLYQDPTFFTTGFDGDQCQGSVGSGFRQGCPLSPDLFVMVLTVIFEDLDWDLLSGEVATNAWSVGKPVYDVEYADDTLLLGQTLQLWKGKPSVTECISLTLKQNSCTMPENHHLRLDFPMAPQSRPQLKSST